MTETATVPGRPDSALAGRYSGTARDLFRLALVTSILTVLTLGIYRFWAKTRIRRYVWSSIAPGGDPMEYTGTGTEKLIGFLIAVVVLGVGLGLASVVLTFFGLMSIEESPEGSYTASGAGAAIGPLVTVPLYFYAVYRARRYRLARTTWRGIRFGMEPGAWGYALRGCGYGLLTVVTLGALWPLMTFRLERYMTERTWYGDARWRQGGRWTMLYPAMKLIGWAVAGGIASGLLAALVPRLAVLAPILGMAAAITGLVGVLHYRLQSMAILARHKTLGEGIGVGIAPRTGEVARTVILGHLGVGLAMAVAGAVISGLGFALIGASIPTGPEMTLDTGAPSQMVLPALILGVVALVMLSLYEPLKIVFVNQPVLAHLVSRAWIEDPVRLTSVHQRQGDSLADADGFADALDVGSLF